MSDLSAFAKNLKRLREENGLTQSALGDKIGVSAQTISGYEKSWISEKGKNPTLDRVLDIAKELNVSLDELCGWNIAKKENKVESLGDLARLIVEMSTWKSVTLDSITSRFEDSMLEFPCILFTDGPLMQFLDDYQKILKLYKDSTINKEMFRDWVSLKAQALDRYTNFGNDNFEEIGPEIDDDGELPFT